MLAVASTLSAQYVQTWDFNENGTTGIANKQSNEDSINSGFFGTDPVAFDGGITGQTGDGNSFAGDLALGSAFNDSNTSTLTMSITLSSWDFSLGTTDTGFGLRFRNDAGGTTISDLSFRKQDGNSRMRFTGTSVAGIVANAESGGALTYGMTLDFVADTYTYWIGTPEADGTAWESRFANHTGTIVGLGTVDIDAIQFLYQSGTDGNQIVIDQIQVTQVVPEPSAYALMGGILALSFVMVRRRR